MKDVIEDSKIKQLKGIAQENSTDSIIRQLSGATDELSKEIYRSLLVQKSVGTNEKPDDLYY